MGGGGCGLIPGQRVVLASGPLYPMVSPLKPVWSVEAGGQDVVGSRWDPKASAILAGPCGEGAGRIRGVLKTNVFSD